MTTSVEVDELLSFAHRVGSDVRVVLHQADQRIEAGTTEVRLRRGSSRVSVPAEVRPHEQGHVVTFTVAQARLGGAAWQLAIQPVPGAPFVRVRARLLARRGQPVALLAGTIPETRLPAPLPRPAETVLAQVSRRLPLPVKKVLRRGRAAVTRK